MEIETKQRREQEETKLNHIRDSMAKLEKTFKFGPRKYGQFTYTGCQIVQENYPSSTIEAFQDDYLNNAEPMPTKGITG